MVVGNVLVVLLVLDIPLNELSYMDFAVLYLQNKICASFKDRNSEISAAENTLSIWEHPLNPVKKW